MAYISRLRKMACTAVLAISANIGFSSLAQADIVLSTPAADDIIRVELTTISSLKAFFIDIGDTVEARGRQAKILTRHPKRGEIYSKDILSVSYLNKPGSQIIDLTGYI